MASQIAILSRTRTLFKTLITQSKPLTTFTFLSQNHELVADDVSLTEPTPLPPNPATGSPLYNENWRTPITNPTYSSLLPSDLTPSFPIKSMSQTLDGNALMNTFADWMTKRRWSDIKQLFQLWIRSLDKHGKPNKPDVGLYNHYLRANLMMGATAGELVDLVAQMDDFGLLPNTASFNLVLKAMFQAKENEAAEKLLQRMEQMGKESQPDDESFSMVIGMLFQTNEIDSALKYIDKSLKQGNMLSLEVFGQCVSSCVNKGMLDTLVSIIEKLKTTDQNKALYPTWGMCNLMANVALQEDNSKLAYYALEFMAKWIARGEAARPEVLLSLDEGLIVSALGTAGRTYSSTLLDASWAILRRSLREKKAPNPESFVAKIYAYSSLGNLPKAFSALHEFETAYGSSDQELHEELFSPFSSLYPLVVACSKKGFETLDMVYYQLENLSRAERPFKSVAALNCVILGCANVWDLDRAYQTFEAISSSFGLSPDIHSYNALMYAFGRLKKTFEASRVFEHMLSVGVRPNAMSYTLLADAHLINRDAKSAMSVIDQMVSAGFVPSKETLKKVRRRCTREMDYESVDRVQSLANEFKYRLGGERRRDMLFNLQFTTNYA